jgi:hypothetical protein
MVKSHSQRLTVIAMGVENLIWNIRLLGLVVACYLKHTGKSLNSILYARNWQKYCTVIPYFGNFLTPEPGFS